MAKVCQLLMAVLKLLRIGNPRPGSGMHGIGHRACVYVPVFTATTLSLYWRPTGSGGARIGAGGHAAVRAVVLHVQ